MLDGYGFLHLGFVDTWPIRSRTEDRVRVHMVMVVRMQAGVRVVGFGLYLALAELPGLDDGHQVIRVLQQCDVGQRIAVDDEQVGPLSGFDGSRLGRDTE